MTCGAIAAALEGIVKRLALALALALGSAGLQAAGIPAGLWQTFDPDTGTARSLVSLVYVDGALTGRIEQLLDGTRVDSTCGACRDERANQPLLGMAIIRNARQDPKDSTVWAGGDILEVRSGKVFKARLRLLEDGRHLEVRGYSGPLHRTQVWVRAGETP